MKRFLGAALAAAMALLCHAQSAEASKLYISEYASLVVITGQLAQVAPEPATDQAPVDFSGGEAKSAALASQTSYVRVVCDVQCSVKFGTSPTATTSSKLLPALSIEYFGVPQGSAYKISVIANP